MRAVDAGDGRLAAGDDAAMQFAYGAFAERRRLRCEFTYPLHGFVMIDRLEMIAQRLAADCDAVLDDLGRLAARERVSLNGVRRVGQLDVVIFLELRER